MPYGLLFFGLVKLIIYLLKDDPETTTACCKPAIQYWVNQRNIPVTHIEQSKSLLGLTNQYFISDREIKLAYHRVLEEIGEQRKSEPVYVDIAELQAARAYMFDRWDYLSSKN